MARAAFNETIASVAADGTLKAISNVEVSVRKVSDNSLAQLWNHRTASAGGNVVSNPFTTGATGACTFYADAGEYNISFHDLTAPARIADQSIGWDSVPGSLTGEVTGFSMGDLKISSQSSDHGRWLKCNGRELSQAEIESALSIAAGEAASFTTYMGTGSGSKYGAAASSKVKIPDARRKALMGAGPSGDTTPAVMAGTTAKNLGDTAGTETHTLTANESGVRTHTHAVGTMSVAAHSHGAGTYVAASHTHADGTLTVAAHTHAFGTLAVDAHTHSTGTYAVGSHTHTPGTFVIPAHSHGAGTLVTPGHHHDIYFNTGDSSADRSITTGSVATILVAHDNHVHLVSGSTGGRVADGYYDVAQVTGNTDTTPSATAIAGTSAATTPGFSGASGTANVNTISGATASTTPDVTGATAATSPAVTGSSATSTATLTGSSGNPDSNTVGGSDASSAHNNMQPYVAIGYVFIRV